MIIDSPATVGVLDIIHGVKVSDPFRWLEDPASRETEDWIQEQRNIFAGYVGELGDMAPLRQRVQALVDIESIDEVGRVGDRLFYRRRCTGQQQPAIYVRDMLADDERLLVDPSRCDPYTAVSILRISHDSNLLAYQIREGGEHTRAISIVDVNTGVILNDRLSRGLARGFVFRSESDGFYYSHDSVPMPHGVTHRIMRHRFGTSNTEDKELLAVPYGRTTKLTLKSEGDFLGASYAHEHEGSPVVDFYRGTQTNDSSWELVCRNVPMPFIPFFYCGRLFAQNFHNAPNGETVELDGNNGTVIRVVIPEWRGRSLQVATAHGRFYVSYLDGDQIRVRVWSLEGECLGSLPLKSGCTWNVLPQHVSEVDELFFKCESTSSPPVICRYSILDGSHNIVGQPRLPAITVDAKSHDFLYPSKDGVGVSLKITGPADREQLYDRPMIMTAYGGFGAALLPQFSVFVSIMLELGFTFATPAIRGGGERGADWHDAGRRRNRQVAFDDFIAAAEWVTKNGLTSPKKLAVFGGSNSGLLVGAVITQRPELFRAALCIGPLLDMVRYHLFDRARVWSPEYGTADDPDDFKALLAYSPYHRVRESVNYPSLMLVCGDKDTRCNPAHARKMTARLQQRTAQSNAILLDCNPERGHTPTMPLSIRIEAITNRIGFICRELGVPLPKEMCL